jgi:hypothetical protein
MSSSETDNKLDFLIREEKPDGTTHVRPRFDFPLNSIFSYMSKEDKQKLLKKSEEEQIVELKYLYRIEFNALPPAHKEGILKKLTYDNSKYDTYGIAEMVKEASPKSPQFSPISPPMPPKSSHVSPISPPMPPKALSQIFEKKSEKTNPRQQLLLISKQLLDSSQGKYANYEMEAKFGTRGIKPLTKMDYDNVVKKLKDMGFTPNNANGHYTLKIQPEFLDFKTGEFRSSGDIDRFRIEIDGLTNIQEYCRTNSLEHIINTKSAVDVKILKKQDVKIGDMPIRSAEFDDFNFRVTYKLEETISKTGKIGQELIQNWNKSKKIFRYIKRISFVNPAFPFWIDMSIVRSSSKDASGRLTKTYNIQDSNVFQNNETYEVEIEVKNVEAKMAYNSPEALTRGVEHIAKIVLSGLQLTNFPCSYTEQKKTIMSYMRLIHESDFKKKNLEYVPKERVYPKDFIGPSSMTLQIKNISPINPDMNIPNITAPYSYVVTDKADGDRHLLYVNGEGRIYLINTNMNVIFTGARTNTKECFNSLLDGELILHDKSIRQFINTFAAFDIYFVNGRDVRARPFVEVQTKDVKYFAEGCRLPMLKEFVKFLKPISIISKSDAKAERSAKSVLEMFKDENKSPITIISKSFYPRFKAKSKEIDNDEPDLPDNYNIFEACNYIQQRIVSGLYNYNTDGLIFTPTLLGVGSNRFLEAGPLKKITWDHSFKWKPPQYNTIDFLVTTKKGADGNDIITPIFESGTNFYETTQFNQYKTLILKVGFDEKRHGYINPCQDVLDDKLPQAKESDNEDNYRPVQFYPSEPYDTMAGMCNVMLEADVTNNPQMFTIDRQTFADNTIVEFAYNPNNSGMWKWEPLRVRYDKTADFKQGHNSFGNDYSTANNNWYSIHNPVTEYMIATGQGIPSEEISSDIYYNNMTSEKLTNGMRDFHNLLVKKVLIQSVSRKGNTLIDYACGKGGDFPKWIAANLSFVFGIDISKDNIENRINGACARFLNYKKDFKQMPYALFVNGNSSQNIRSGQAMLSDKAIAITKAIFGTNAADQKLGPAVARQHGKGADGFNVSSCQFALHYMFENNVTFYNFVRNLAECTRINGYFIATSYDGKSVFKMLSKKEQGESVDIYKDDVKVWSVAKDYDAVSFADDDSSLGYQISVYQDSINQTLPEYLVNFDFFVAAMEKYGFQLIKRDEAKSLGLPEGSGMFIELYNMMMDNIKRNPSISKDYGDAPNMTKYEKDISFLNRYFVFKKVAERNVEKLTNTILGKLPSELSFELDNTIAASKAVAEEDKVIEKRKARPLKKKITLIEATEAVDEPIEVEAQVEIEVTKTKPKPKAKASTKKVGEEPGVNAETKKTSRKAKPKQVEFEIADEP